MTKLAIEGGPRAKKHPYGRGKRFGAAELRQLREALEQETLFYHRGTKVRRMCETFRRMIRAKHCVASSSGTASIHVALGALGLRPGDEVITGPITDFGSVIGILYQNAIPIFCDLEAHTYNMTAKTIEAAITRKTRVILVVHLAGNPTDMDPILRLAKRRGLAVVEDCAQSWLASLRGRFVGTMGDVGCFSLNDFKHISAGDGGMVVTNRDDLAEKLAMFADKNYRRTAGGTPLREIASLAPNYRMTELQGAVGLAQLGKLKSICRRRHIEGDGITRGIRGIPGVHPHEVVAGGRCTYWFYMMRVEPGVLGVSREEFVAALQAEGLAASAGYISHPLYLWEIFRRRSAFPGTHFPWDSRFARKGIRYRRGDCPVAEEILATSVRLTVNEHHTKTDVRETVAGVRKVAGYYLAKQGIEL
ncbi:MAG TPA: DegT/DnrJ/EryC1/StrS family aminotransferase [Planctomycetota bacterium]|nr:DegT/DnrJ/EryC1/StrS family aminotransferase [Planctomycetota bacterium]